MPIFPLPSTPDILYYHFELNDNGNGVCPSGYSTDQDFYADDDVKFYGGGYGGMYDIGTGTGSADEKGYQITLYDPAFNVPEWMQRGVVYQIFPDRFRDGNAANNPTTGRFSYNTSGTIVRSGQSNWNYTVCDPRSTYSPSCDGKYGDNFYGGDLAGITEKINAGYFDQLGVSVLYLNPIFLSPSNHKYDTANFMKIDPDFGTLADFTALVNAANSHNIKIILDGVFNHTSSDSVYFDRYKRYDAGGNLISTAEGADDNSGACESPNSSYRSWFFIPDPPEGDPEGNKATDRCDSTDADDTTGGWDQTYTAWYGYGSLPKLQANSTAVRTLIWSNGLASVGPFWTHEGASGWRFDVGGDVDPGLTKENPLSPNNYWEGFRSAVRTSAVTGKSDTLMLGEEWGDASPWLLGNEWDSVMNYRYRSAVMSWLFTGCSGDGCTGGTSFADNDSNSNSSSGSISYISPSQFNARLRSIQEDYPPMAWMAMMNLEGSHDTNRIRFLLKKSNNDSDAAAVQRMKEMWMFAFTYAGAPTLYYGDEMGLNHDGVWSGTKWEDDPYNRTPFPWNDTTGSSYAADTGLQDFARKMSSIRNSYRALQDGDVQHGIVIDDVNKVYGFARTNDTQTAIILLNRDGVAHDVTLSGLDNPPYNLDDGTILLDVVMGNTYTVSGGGIILPTSTITVNPAWGVILLEQAEIETPAAPASPSIMLSGTNITLGWNMVSLDTQATPEREVPTSYTIHRSAIAGFAPDSTPVTGNQIAIVNPPAYGIANARLTSTSSVVGGENYYSICAVNAGGKMSCAPLATQCASDTSLYRSAATGSWTDSATWQFSTNSGVDWAAASCWPTSSNGAIQIQNGHTVMVAESLSIDQTTIDSGGQVTVNSGTAWTVADGTGTDLAVNGTLVNAGTVTMTGIGSFGIGSTYQHDQNGGVIPTATWASTSTVLVTGITTTAPTGLGQSFGNFSWISPGQTVDMAFAGSLTTVNGDFTVTVAGARQISLVADSPAALTVNIGGDLIVNNGTVVFSTGTSVPTVSVSGDVLLTAGTLRPATGSGVPIFNVNGNWTNNGGTFTPGIGAVTFTGTVAQTIGGNTSTTFNNITVNKGTSQSNVVEATGPMSMTGNLTLTNGTLKLTHASAIARFTNVPTAPVIPATAGIWVNGGTLNGGNFSTTNNGLIRVSAGTANFGTNSGNSIGAAAGASFIIEGGTLNIAGRLRASNAITYNQSGGTVNVATAGNGSSNDGSFDLDAPTTSFTMSGGNIVLVQANTTSGTKVDYRVSAASPTITGGTLQVGNNSTATNFTFRLSGQMPNLVVDNTTNAKTALLFGAATVNDDVTINSGATLDSGNFDMAVNGNWTNNGGTFTPGTGTVTFNGTSSQTIGGSAATTFNSLTVSNAAGVSLSGVDATVNGTLTFTSGKITTGANTLILGLSGPISSAGAGKYVYGNLQKPVATTSIPTTINFEVGDATDYAPISVTFSSVTTAGALTGSTTDGQHPRYMDVDISSSDYINRYWTLTPSAGLTFTSYNATFTFVNGTAPGDYVGFPTIGSLVLQKYDYNNPPTVPSTWTNPTTTSSTSTDVTGTGFTSFSDFYTGNGGTPLPVTLSYFTTTGFGTSVTFDWSTVTESANVGFNLYAQDGDQRIRLNAELIPSQASDSLSRLDYSFQAETSSDVFYIEDVNINGQTDLHGPYSLGQEYGSRVEENRIDWASIQAERVENESADKETSGLERSADRPQMMNLNLKVNQSGLYRVTYEMLRDAGLDLNGLPAANLMLTNRGRQVPMYVAGADPFGPGGYVEFYGEALDTIYTDTNVYNLQVSPTPVDSLVDDDDKAISRDASGQVSTYTETLEINQQRAFANYAPGADAWYDTSMLAYKTSKSWEFSFNLDELSDATEANSLELVVWGVTNWPQSPDHRLQVSVNGLQVATDSFDGLTERIINVKLPADLLQEGANTLRLTLPGDTGVDWDMINLDKFSVTYSRRLQAREGRLDFTAAGDSFTVSNLPSRDVVAYRLNGEKGMTRLEILRVEANPDGTFSAIFRGSPNLASYQVSTVETMYAPAFEMSRPKVERENPAEYVIITHPDFIDGLQPLIAARKAQGLTVKVVNVNDLYARYTYGIFDPQAIQQYISHAAKKLGAKYVLLVGGDTYDYRNYLDVDSISFIPSLYVATGDLAKFVPADPLYADLDGDNLPDLALGRFPVRSVAELNLMVSKTLAYTAKDYGQTAAFSSDLNDGGLSFKNINTDMAAQLPAGWSVENIHLNDLSVSTARNQLIAAMNRGTALVTFTGHSGPQEWTFSGLFNINNAAALTNHGKPFVVVQWGCWNNYHVDPVNDYLVQSFLFSGDQGAAAVLGASTLTDSTSEILLGELLTPRLATPGLTLGQALQLSKSELAQTHPEALDVLLGWTLMGDPALVIVP